MYFSDYQLHKFFKRKLKDSGYEELYDYLEYAIDVSVFNDGSIFRSGRSSLVTQFVKKFFKSVLIFLLQRALKVNKSRSGEVCRGLSQASFRYDDLLISSEMQISRVFWAPKRGLSVSGTLVLAFRYWVIKYTLSIKAGENLLNPSFLRKLSRFNDELMALVERSDFDFLLVSEDMTFESRILIDTFKKCGKPTFLLCHGGIHSFYGRRMDTRTDFVGQWGELQVGGFTKNGYDPLRFFVTGHPFYSSVPEQIRFSLDDVLVLSKSVQGSSLLSSRFSEDRGRAVTYMLVIKRVLQSLGVTKARFRPHPSENADWYSSFFKGFYEVDSETLPDSLSRASLVVGPLSTTIVDALCIGVNYCLFEPVINRKNIFEGDIASPLDTCGDEFPWAHSAAELEEIIEHKKCVSREFAVRLCSPGFDAIGVRQRILEAVRGC